MEEKVLIVGAGPTGLVSALWLAKLGIPLRIIDKSQTSGETSRAMAVHARTLEFYQQIGFANEAVAEGIIVEHINLRKNGSLAASIELKHLGKDVSPFPFVLSFPQDDHEKLLIAQLEKLGITVERDTELVDFTHNAESVTATLKKNNESETITTPFLLGCDGARSTVRKNLNIDFPGGTYSQLFYVADVMATGDVVNGYMQLCLSGTDFSLVFPIRSSGSVRLIGIVPKEYEQKENIIFEDVKESVIKNTKLSISKLNWFSTYHSHHRVAKHFRDGRVFLLGDAGHIHSPVGGQGMNTGIGDAVNLSWKIAAVFQKKASMSLLDTYEPERIAFARRLIATTDTAFQAITNPGLLGKFVRNIFFPHIVPFFLRFERVKHFLFNTVSQTKIQYRFSSLSNGAAGKVHGGDRLPWVKFDNTDNFAPLTSLNWQIHIYGQASEEFKNAMKSLELSCHEFPWNESAEKAGLEKNAVYLIRPDGYVSYANSVQDVDKIKTFRLKWALLNK